jgi:hypothetical protein
MRYRLLQFNKQIEKKQMPFKAHKFIASDGSNYQIHCAQPLQIYRLFYKCVLNNSNVMKLKKNNMDHGF